MLPFSNPGRKIPVFMNPSTMITKPRYKARPTARSFRHRIRHVAHTRRARRAGRKNRWN
jgi:hypothetical protein